VFGGSTTIRYAAKLPQLQRDIGRVSRGKGGRQPLRALHHPG
jgi:hypothetical protein